MYPYLFLWAWYCALSNMDWIFLEQMLKWNFDLIWKNKYYEECDVMRSFHVCCLSSTDTGKKLRRIRWAVYVLHIGGKKNAPKVGACKPNRSSKFGSAKCRYGWWRTGSWRNTIWIYTLHSCTSLRELYEKETNKKLCWKSERLTFERKHGNIYPHP